MTGSLRNLPDAQWKEVDADKSGRFLFDPVFNDSVRLDESRGLSFLNFPNNVIRKRPSDRESIRALGPSILFTISYSVLDVFRIT